MLILGFIAAVFIGFVLGLIGGGGSILTIPVLVYLLQIEPVLATTYSLFVVGATSVVGTFSYYKNKLIHFPVALAFGIPSLIMVFISRNFILPALPDLFFQWGSFQFTKALFVLLLLAGLMVLTAFGMIGTKQKKVSASTETVEIKLLPLFFQGALVGLLTGMVGAGGGFLIIPALVLMCKLPMKRAVGTSLFIISVNSLIGFFTDRSISNIDYTLLLEMSAFAILGILVGSYYAKKVDSAKLKPAFGYFILIIGIYIIIKELGLL